MPKCNITELIKSAERVENIAPLLLLILRSTSNLELTARVYPKMNGLVVLLVCCPFGLVWLGERLKGFPHRLAEYAIHLLRAPNIDISMRLAFALRAKARDLIAHMHRLPSVGLSVSPAVSLLVCRRAIGHRVSGRRRRRGCIVGGGDNCLMYCGGKRGRKRDKTVR